MIINNSKEVEVLGNVQQSKFRVAADPRIFMKLLSESFYNDPISSIVREIVSNAWDAHVMAGTDEAVQVHIYDEEGQSYFEVIDKGTGMSPELVEQVFTVYGESNKREDNKAIGGFG